MKRKAVQVMIFGAAIAVVAAVVTWQAATMAAS
jgi:hypothetical protein